MRTISTLPLLALSILPFVSSIPVTISTPEQEPDIWVTKYNTLNATTWAGPGQNSSAKSWAIDRSPFQILKSVYRPSIPRYQSGRALNVTVSSKDFPVAYETTNLNSTTFSNATYPNITTSAHGHLNTTSDRNTTRWTPYLEGNSWNQSLAVDRFAIAALAGNGVLPLQLVNRLPSANVKAWVTGLDSNGALIMLGQDGTWKYPTTTSPTPVPVPAGVTIPLAGPNTTLPITLPGYITSGRIWIADGNLQFYLVATPTGPGLVEPAVANVNDPNAAVNYAFAELTWGPDSGIYADISAVDFVGLPLGIQLEDASGIEYSVLGTPSNAAGWLCDQLKAQALIDGFAWNELCAYDTNGNVVRVLSPNNYLASNPHAFGTYYGEYIGDVWNHYTNNNLIINTQTDAGNVTCRVVADELTCAGDNRGYARPDNYDIFGCNTGPFAIQAGDNAIHYAVVPRLCAAFNRATLLIDGGNVTPSVPPSEYYQPLNRPVNTRPLNHYSALVHQMEMGGKGYAFSYDDVTPSAGEDQSGLVASTSPRLLRVIVGGT